MAGGLSPELPYIDLQPYLALVIQLLDITGIIPDPLSLILSLFSGRPKEEATAQISDWLVKSRNPAARIWGIEIGRYLVEVGAVLSDGHPAVQQVYAGFRSQFSDSMQRMGFSAAEITQAINEAMSRAAQAGAPYPPALQKGAPAGFHIGGPSSVQGLYNQGLAKAQSIGLTGQRAVNYAQKFVLQRITLRELSRTRIDNPNKCQSGETFDWPTGTCITGGQPPQICPPGQVWDPLQGKCVPQPTGPQPCGPNQVWDPTTQQCIPIVGNQPQCPTGYVWDPTAQACVLIPTGPPPVDDDPDELSACCEASVTALQAIATAILNLQLALAPGQGNPQSDQCCANLVAAIQGVVDAVALLTNSLPSAPDLSSIDADLQAIAAALSSSSAALTADVAAIAPAVTGAGDTIAKAISNAPATDVSGIVDQLKLIVKEGDVKQPIIDWLTQQGFLNPQLAQLTHGADWADVIFAHIRTMFWTGLTNWWKTIGGTGYTATFKPLPLGQTIANDISAAISAALSAGAEPVYPVVKGVVDAVVAILNPSHPPLPADIGVDPDLVLSKTLAPALIINGVALLASYFGWEISEQLREYVDITTAFVGLEEVKELKVGARMRNGPAKVAELQAKALYRQELPGYSNMAGLVAQGLYPQARAQALRPLTGLPDEFEAPVQAAAYRGLNPRQMLRLIETNLFSQADIHDELTFAGMRPASQKRMLLAAPYLATASERSAARLALEAQYVAGFLDQATLLQLVDSLESNVDRDSLIITRVTAQKIVAHGKQLEEEYSALFIGGAISDVTFRNYLAGIGLQPDAIDIVAGRAEARANVQAIKSNIRQAAAQARETAHLEQRAALQTFKAGASNVGVLTAALIASGLTPAQAAAWSVQATMQQQGSVRWKYGLQLPPAQALQLAARVSALTDQRKRNLISDAQYVADLQALHLPPSWINALQAAADAMLTPKSAAFAVAVQTN